MPQQTYTPEQTTQVLELYAQETPVETIAELLEKSTRSIISKLVRENVYQQQPQPPARLKKSEMIQRIAELLEIPAQELESLEKATHPSLSMLLARLEA